MRIVCWQHQHVCLKDIQPPLRLRGPPFALGKRGSDALPFCSTSQEVKAAITSLRKGVQRSFRPLPLQRTCAPLPRTMSWQASPISSETLRPV